MIEANGGLNQQRLAVSTTIIIWTAHGQRIAIVLYESPVPYESLVHQWVILDCHVSVALYLTALAFLNGFIMKMTELATA